jgi:hypothetical protein
MPPSIVTEYGEKLFDEKLRAGIGISTSTLTCGTAIDERCGVEQAISLVT